MVATRSQGHVQIVTGDSKSGKYSTLWVFSAREAVGGKFSGRTTVYQFNVSVHEYYYAVCTWYTAQANKKWVNVLRMKQLTLSVSPISFQSLYVLQLLGLIIFEKYLCRSVNKDFFTSSVIPPFDYTSYRLIYTTHTSKQILSAGHKFVTRYQLL